MSKKRIYKTKKSKGGREALPSHEKRNPFAMVHANFEETRIIKANAKEAKMSVSEYLREMGIKGKVIVPDQTPIVKAELLAELTRQGQNYNQITKKINAGMQINEKDRDGLNALYKTLKQIYDEIQN